MTVEKIQQLLQELGPNTPDIDAVAQTEDPSWAIQFSDETVILIEPTDDPGRMVITKHYSQLNTELHYEAKLRAQG